jgi:hypothetical protein
MHLPLLIPPQLSLSHMLMACYLQRGCFIHVTRSDADEDMCAVWTSPRDSTHWCWPNQHLVDVCRGLSKKKTTL